MTNQWDDALDRAAKMGRDAGKAGGSWVLDGNTSTETLRECIRLNDDGDPEWFEYFGVPYGPLSGEYADGLLPRHLAERLGQDPNLPYELLDQLADAYEDAFYQAWDDEVMRSAHAMLPDEE